jgi:hypothetical protein
MPIVVAAQFVAVRFLRAADVGFSGRLSEPRADC